MTFLLISGKIIFIKIRKARNDMKTILLQGDSITDTDRSRTNDVNTGYGYATMVMGELGAEYPGEYTIYNRGISGNRIVDVYARIKKDIINLKPDVMSILIGVNDVWHELGFGGGNGVDAEKYFKIYSMLIEEIKEALPQIKIMILEPFTLPGTGNAEYYEEFRMEVEKRAEKSKAIAEKFSLPFVKLQKYFDEAAKLTTADMWLHDGVHPTAAGHGIIKREWIKCFSGIE